MPCGVAKNWPYDLQKGSARIGLPHPGDDIEHLGHVGDGHHHLFKDVQGELGVQPDLVRQSPCLLLINVLSLG